MLLEFLNKFIISKVAKLVSEEDHHTDFFVLAITATWGPIRIQIM